MFNQGWNWGFLRINADNSYTRRVFNLYLRRHQDDLLGLGYHHYQQSGRGCLEFSCSFCDLFFGNGFYPRTTYFSQRTQTSAQDHVLNAIATYDPEIEVLAYLQVQKSDLRCLSRISKKGLALSVIHRQYLNRLLNQATLTRSVTP